MPVTTPHCKTHKDSCVSGLYSFKEIPFLLRLIIYFIRLNHYFSLTNLTFHLWCPPQSLHVKTIGLFSGYLTGNSCGSITNILLHFSQSTLTLCQVIPFMNLKVLESKILISRVSIILLKTSLASRRRLDLSPLFFQAPGYPTAIPDSASDHVPSIRESQSTQLAEA